MAAYSPISTRNHRINTTLPYHISSTANPSQATGTTFNMISGTAANTSMHGNLTGGSRRRESVNSSIGATSIRRLLTVNRGCTHKIPLHVRAKVAKNFIFLIIAHGLMCAVLIPLFGLQVNEVCDAWFLHDVHFIAWNRIFIHLIFINWCMFDRRRIQFGFIKSPGYYG